MTAGAREEDGRPVADGDPTDGDPTDGDVMDGDVTPGESATDVPAPRERRQLEEGSWRHRMRHHKVLGPFYRVAVLIVGLALIAAGLAMLVLPGPGWVVIILGLVVLAPEYTWADRLLDPVERFAKAAAERALDPRKRRQNLLILIAVIVLGAVVLGLYLWRYGLDYEPLPFL